MCVCTNLKPAGVLKESAREALRGGGGGSGGGRRGSVGFPPGVISGVISGGSVSPLTLPFPPSPPA